MSNKFCTNCGAELIKKSTYCPNCGKKRPKKSKWWFLIIVVVLGAMFFSWFFDDSGENFIEESISELIMKTSQEEDPKWLDDGITSAVVNVVCPYFGEPMYISSDGIGGSGVVIDEEGIILTNSHVIPQDGDLLDVNEEGCIVVFSDKENGLPREAYLANPYVMGEYSDEYDLAWLEIYDVYVDINGKEYGTFPKRFFSALEDGVCDDENIKLGEKVKIYGYPQATGGYSLTITEGVVSAFTADGLITSAKIGFGNSGGLATDDKGCFIGIPSAVNIGEAESYGIIITTDEIVEFFEKIDY